MRQGYCVRYTIRLRIILALLGLLGGQLGDRLGGESAWAQNGPGGGTMSRTHERGGGSRGCGLAAPGGETLLAAKPSLVLLGAEGVMQTGAPSPLFAWPLFAWYVRDRGSWPLEFRIYRQRPGAPDEADLVVELASNAVVSQPGIMTLTLPEPLPPPEPGQRYWWQVELACDPQDTSANIFAEAELEVSSTGRLLNPGLEQGRGQTPEQTPEQNPAQTLGLWLRAKARGEALLPERPDWAHWGLTVAEAQAVELVEVSWVGLPRP